jgi:predicted esterase
MSRLMLLGGIFMIAGLWGCSSPSRGWGSPGLLTEADWPPRLTKGLRYLAANVPGVLSCPSDVEAGTPVRVVRAAAYGLGVVLELDDADGEETSSSVQETELVFVSFSPLGRDEQRLEDRPGGLRGRIAPEDLWEGVCWHLYEPRDVSACGLVVHLGGNKYVRRALLADGWAVLSAANTGRCLRRRANPVSFEVERGERVNEVAAEIAEIFDDELADWPYSLEAVLQYLRDWRPDLRQTPSAIMGFSIGALGLPAVVARLPDRFGAAVLVAGGANLLEVSHRTTKTDSGLELSWAGAPPRQEDWQELYAAYLGRARLDPYHTAAALAGMPVLVYHGHYDRVVPADTGELLFGRLNEAQRYAFPVGHQHLLRVVMRLQAGHVVEWMKAALASSPDGRGKTPLP